METTVGIFSTYLVQLPLIVVWLVGLFLAARTYRRDRRVSLLIVLALVILLLRTLTTPLLTFWLFMKQPPLQRRALVQLAINIGSVVAATTSWVLVLIALFAGRSQG
jgi:hypothetical protein